MRGIRQGEAELAALCPHMRRALAEVGPLTTRKRAPGFQTLIRIIVDQQVSKEAGAAIWARLERQLGTVTPETVLAAGETGLRAGGLSGQKARYALGAAEAVISGALDFRRLTRRPDDEVIETLTALKGIGLWSAEIYLMFAMGRRDVFPAGDLALQIAAGQLLSLDERPTDKEIRAIAEERWRPWRSVAALCLWRYYRRTRAPVEG